MQKKLTVADKRADVPQLAVGEEMNAAYRQMARDEAREADALELAEATVGDVADEPQ